MEIGALRVVMSSSFLPVPCALGPGGSLWGPGAQRRGWEGCPLSLGSEACRRGRDGPRLPTAAGAGPSPSQPLPALPGSRPLYDPRAGVSEGKVSCSPPPPPLAQGRGLFLPGVGGGGGDCPRLEPHPHPRALQPRPQPGRPQPTGPARLARGRGRDARAVRVFPRRHRQRVLGF